MPWRSVNVLFTGLAYILLPATARAEWYVQAYLGASHTFSATLTTDLGDARSRATYADVPLDGRSFESPPYYGYRVGTSRGRLGFEAELTHLKVFARSGTLGPYVERFSISHGLNLLVGNVVWRQRLTARVRLAFRGGAGVAIPHAESRVRSEDQEQYEVSGLALTAAAGPEFLLGHHARAFAEYKLSTTAPGVSVPGGTISGRYTSQQAAAGMGVAW
jgi:hypothetical protein